MRSSDANSPNRKGSEAPEKPKLKFRMGINLGEITFDHDDFYGDGVNIAARLEGLSGVPAFVSRLSFARPSAKKSKLLIRGYWRTLCKNIDDPRQGFPYCMRNSCAKGYQKRLETSNEAQMPSIAVLPFDNMSSDAEQDFFADGLSEDNHRGYLVSTTFCNLQKLQLSHSRESYQKQQRSQNN